MKSGIHPQYAKATITCACGAVYELGSTRKNAHVEVCAACHPFYTGEQRAVDAGGRVVRFNKRYARQTAQKA